MYGNSDGPPGWNRSLSIDRYLLDAHVIDRRERQREGFGPFECDVQDVELQVSEKRGGCESILPLPDGWKRRGTVDERLSVGAGLPTAKSFSFRPVAAIDGKV